MSRELIDRNADLVRLESDGYNIEIKNGTYLLIHDVPYVTPSRQVQRGILVMELTPGPGGTHRPKDHTAHFVGETPSKPEGEPLHAILNNSNPNQLLPDLLVNHYFSAKAAYRDHHHKVTTYVALITRHAKRLDPGVTAKTRRAARAQDDPLFHYPNTAPALAGLDKLEQKHALGKVAIVGVGGTGSYILDLIVKTRIQEIHMFDGDILLDKNAYRAPGAATRADLESDQHKVDYYFKMYSGMRKSGLIAHPYYIDESNHTELREMQFVFLSMDAGDAKRHIVDALIEWGVPFVDAGLDMRVDQEERLIGTTRTVLVTPDYNSHSGRIPLSAAHQNDIYDSNIQIVELNALNAVMAVIKWKKYIGYYADSLREHASYFNLRRNSMLNKELHS